MTSADTTRGGFDTGDRATERVLLYNSRVRDLAYKHARASDVRVVTPLQNRPCISDFCSR